MCIRDRDNSLLCELAAYLTVKFEDYTRDAVQATLQWLFEQQYEPVSYTHLLEPNKLNFNEGRANGTDYQL